MDFNTSWKYQLSNAVTNKALKSPTGTWSIASVETGRQDGASERMRRTLCRNGVFQYYDDLQIWNPFSDELESNSLPSPDFYQKQTLLEGFLKVVWTLWEMRLQGRYGATVLSPTSHVPMCVLSEMHQFLGETESVQMERHTCASTCTHTHGTRIITDHSLITHIWLSGFAYNSILNQ